MISKIEFVSLPDMYPDMRKYLIYYFLLVIVGIIISLLISSLIHSVLDKPRGVPLARLGLAGTVTQIGLVVFPLIFAPIITGVTFFGSQQRLPTQKERRNLVLAVAASTLLVWVALFVASGIWFGVLQGGVGFVAAFLFGPPIFSTATFWILFPLTLQIISGRTRQ